MHKVIQPLFEDMLRNISEIVFLRNHGRPRRDVCHGPVVVLSVQTGSYTAERRTRAFSEVLRVFPVPRSDRPA